MTRNSSFKTKLVMFVILPLDFHHTPSATCSRPAFPLNGALPFLHAPLPTFWIFQARIEEGSASLVMRTLIPASNDPPILGGQLCDS